MKIQKILDKDIKKNLKISIWRELEFYRFINKLNKKDQIFFTKLIDYEIVNDCNFKQDRIFVDKETINLDKSKSCLYLCLELKDGNISSINLDERERKSLLIQILYAIYLMRKKGWMHQDIHPANICYKEVDKNSYVKITVNKKTYKIPTYGYIFSLIDYGFVINNSMSTDKKAYKYNFKYNTDLLWFIEDYCLNGYYNAREINKNKINIKKLPLKIIKFVKENDNILYNKIKYILTNIYLYDFNKMLKKKDQIFFYNFMQFVKIYSPDIYYQVLEIRYTDNLFSEKLLEFIKFNYDNMEFIISEIIKLLS